MASIIERITKTGKKKYQVYVRVKGQPPQTATFDRKTDAKEWSARTETQLRQALLHKSAA
ncbi:hypothetical protein [Chitinibacter tainanensis]|uniref:hypothetical protein n=1 Tax=Chitinibacter tainanensis TaxID=230667 RepID=UPI000551E21F|nr:hypothetical protein [Chitinibacter tainanensis]